MHDRKQSLHLGVEIVLCAVAEQRSIYRRGRLALRLAQNIRDALVSGGEGLRLRQPLEIADRLKTRRRNVNLCRTGVDDCSHLIRRKAKVAQVAAQALIKEIEERVALALHSRDTLESLVCEIHQRRQ